MRTYASICENMPAYASIFPQRCSPRKLLSAPWSALSLICCQNVCMHRAWVDQRFCRHCVRIVHGLWMISAWMKREFNLHCAWQCTGSQVCEIRGLWRNDESVVHGPCPGWCMSGCAQIMRLLTFSMRFSRLVHAQMASSLLHFICAARRTEFVAMREPSRWCCEHLMLMLAYASICTHMPAYVEYTGTC